jgi:hypothetical protein
MPIMTWCTDDRHLYWQQRKLDEEQACALREMERKKREDEALRAHLKGQSDADA